MVELSERNISKVESFILYVINYDLDIYRGKSHSLWKFGGSQRGYQKKN